MAQNSTGFEQTRGTAVWIIVESFLPFLVLTLFITRLKELIRNRLSQKSKKDYGRLIHIQSNPTKSGKQGLNGEGRDRVFLLNRL
ncbi:hypothetical protein L2E82_11303 [Cichorium intybus]|uniref:Uncharacterized protein n=1 Tax=Cichorium intybus TaxID=13427 RepID=A0ACB9GCY0_CICIN|nr:hypothetical protein L2E82_11303 [Cichorium intybus]